MISKPKSTITYKEVTVDGIVVYVKVLWGEAHIGNIYQQAASIGGDWYYKAFGSGKGPFRGHKTIASVKVALEGE